MFTALVPLWQSRLPHTKWDNINARTHTSNGRPKANAYQHTDTNLTHTLAVSAAAQHNLIKSSLSLSHARSQSTSRAVSLSGSLTFSSSFAIYIFTLNSHDTRGTSSTLSFCSQLLVSCFVFVYPFLKWQSYIFKNNKNNKYLADN